MKAVAYAKVNLALEVGGLQRGLHTIRSVAQSISWHDDVELDRADEDRIEVPDGGAPADQGNLAWRALDAVRDVVGAAAPARLVLRKRIPARAGLGGGSADAAAVAALASRMFGIEPVLAERALHLLGSDVPFSMRGGTAIVTGTGEEVQPLEPATGFAIAIVVPPIELGTPEVYRRWDQLDGPEGPAAPASTLPPSLRDLAPLRNDLYPAAVSLDPVLDDWRRELADIWGLPVSMTGSGSALYGFFATSDEAEDAVRAAPAGARATNAATPVPEGWSFVRSPDRTYE